MKIKKTGMTLIELIISIVLLTVVIIGTYSIDLFSNNHVLGAQRTVKVQNEVTYILEHMKSRLYHVVGNTEPSTPDRPLTINVSGSQYTVIIQIDSDNNGIWNNPPDVWGAYRFEGTSGMDRFQVKFCNSCVNSNCGSCSDPGNWNTINPMSFRILEFAPWSGPNYLGIQMTGVYDPNQSRGINNPSVGMRNRIWMPSVSAN